MRYMMKKLTRTLFLSIAAFALFMHKAYAEDLNYRICINPNTSTQCFIAFHKLRTVTNPLTGDMYFHKGFHISEGDIRVYPTLHIASADLDGDGLNEIIVKIPEDDEELQGYFCKEDDQCPTYILQDRTLPGQKPSLRNFKVMGPVFAFAVGLSTDERFGNFISLRAYKDRSFSQFDVYQYDRKSDNYFNISAVR